MILRLIVLTTLTIIVVAEPLPAQPPQAGVPRLLLTRPEATGGLLGKELIEALLQGLRERGYIDGQNLSLEVLWSAGETGKIARRIADTTQPKLDFIITSGTSTTREARKATSAIPIIMANGSADPVAEGFAINYARPGGNITGVTNLSVDLSGKRLELLKEAVPKSNRVALLLELNRPRAAELKHTQDAAQALGLRLQVVVAHGVDEYSAAFQSIKQNRADALMVVSGAGFNSNRSRILEFAAKSRLPAMYSEQNFVNAGGLMVYASVVTEQYRRAAVYIDKILKGAKPSELPIEQPTKFEFIINLKSAKQIGLTLPPNLLARADRVIR